MYLLIQYFEQCVVVNRACVVGMLLVEGLRRCLSVAPSFPDKNTVKIQLKAVGTWSSKFCRLNKTNSSLVPFIKVYNPD